MSQEITKALLPTATEKARAAARFMYGVGVVAATDRKTITYSAIASGLQAMKLGYSYRSLGTALDALAAYCDQLHVPDLSAIYEPKQTGTPGRWKSQQVKDSEAKRCFNNTAWPGLP
jgi:hypothetical protein